MPVIITVENLTKTYGSLTAVDNISFAIRQGEIFGILGPNGAGKTTTLEMIEGLKPITSGSVTVDSLNVTKKSRAVKSIIGVQLQSSSFFDGLNLRELIETFASLYGRKINGLELLRKVQLQDKAESMVKELSGGQKQRLSVAVALVNNPKVLFLDEPTTGLDPQARRNLWQIITDINREGKTIVLTTHYMEEAEILCDRIAIMDQAKIIELDTTENLIKKSGINSSISFRLEKPCPHESFNKLPGVEKTEKHDLDYLLISGSPAKTLPALFSHTQTCGPLITLQLRQPTLEDVFLKLTGKTLRE